MALLLLVGIGRRRGALLALVAFVAFAASACSERYTPPGPPAPEPPRVITNLDGLPGEICGTSLRVWVENADGSRFCIDRFEASLDGGDLGDAHQGSDDLDVDLNGSTVAAAIVELGVAPASGISWYQAKAACANAGARLCSLSEWQRACRGPRALIYPYADTMDELACNGFYARTGSYDNQTPLPTGSLNSCGSAWGAYDLSGNLEEWIEDGVPRTPGTTPLTDRAVRGGSFKSNSNALACVGDEFHEPPGSTDVDRGFRCCTDGP